jgi:hypothetical protein
MTDESKPVFAYLDTNVFVEFRPPRELPWKQILGADKVVLVVAAVVVTELQMKKDNGTLSRKKRERVADRIRLIEGDLSSTAGSSKLVSLSDGVDWMYEADTPPDEVYRDHHLDRRVRDDALAAFVLARSLKGDNTCLVADDAGARMRVRALGLRAVELPEEGRLVELDEAEKQNRELKARIASYESRAPAPSLQFANGTTVLRYTFPCPRANDDIAPCMEYYQQAYTHWNERPAAMRIVDMMSALGGSPSTEDIAKYNAAIDRFHEEMRQALPGLLEHHTRLDSYIRAQLVVRNEGSAPAHDVEVILDAPADATFAATLPKEPPRPSPPDRPRSSLEFLRNLMDYASKPNLGHRLAELNLGSVQQFQQYWSVSPNGQRAKVAVGKLKHSQQDPLPDLFIVLPGFEIATGCRIPYEIHADNVSSPTKGFLDVAVGKGTSPRRFKFLQGEDEGSDDSRDDTG